MTCDSGTIVVCTCNLVGLRENEPSKEEGVIAFSFLKEVGVNTVGLIGSNVLAANVVQPTVDEDKIRDK